MNFGTILGGVSLFALGAMIGSHWTTARMLLYLSDPEGREKILSIIDEELEKDSEA